MSQEPTVAVCVLCGLPLPKRSWWARLTDTVAMTHDPNGPMGEECWQRFNQRHGIENPGPRPQVVSWWPHDETTQETQMTTPRPGMATSKTEWLRKYGGWTAAGLVMWTILILGLIKTFGG